MVVVVVINEAEVIVGTTSVVAEFAEVDEIDVAPADEVEELDVRIEVEVLVVPLVVTFPKEVNATEEEEEVTGPDEVVAVSYGAEEIDELVVGVADAVALELDESEVLEVELVSGIYDEVEVEDGDDEGCESDEEEVDVLVVELVVLETSDDEELLQAKVDDVLEDVLVVSLEEVVLEVVLLVVLEVELEAVLLDVAVLEVVEVLEAMVEELVVGAIVEDDDELEVEVVLEVVEVIEELVELVVDVVEQAPFFKQSTFPGKIGQVFGSDPKNGFNAWS